MRIVLLAIVVAGCGGRTPRVPGSCDGPCPVCKIDHLVVIIQENHTFDNYFGRYCTAAPGSTRPAPTGPGAARRAQRRIHPARRRSCSTTPRTARTIRITRRRAS